MSAARSGPVYRFVSEIGSGGMGRIELVVRREGTFARAYARKRPLGDLALDVDVRDMLLEEARVAGLARNAHVVPVLDVGEDDEGVYLVMDFVDGVPLDRITERLGPRLPLQCVVEIARQIAEGLHAVHETTSTEGTPLEIVHRDLTPSNVLVGFDGIARVSDFGIARARDRAALSRPGVLKGKKSYMAPEQLRARPVDRRTDLFALGVVIAEMVAGARLHGDVTPMERARRTLEDPPLDIGELRADVPPELVALAFELMAREPADRPRDARLVASRLAAIRDQLRIEEGSIDLGELVRARFDDVQRENDRMLATALRDQDPTVQMDLPDQDTTSVDRMVSDLRSLPSEPLSALTGALPDDDDSLVVRELPTDTSAADAVTKSWTMPARDFHEVVGAAAVSAPKTATPAPRPRIAIGLVTLVGALSVLGLVSLLVWWTTRDVSETPETTPAPAVPVAPPTVAASTRGPDPNETSRVPSAQENHDVRVEPSPTTEVAIDPELTTAEPARADDPDRETPRDRTRSGSRTTRTRSTAMDTTPETTRTTWAWE